MSLVRRARARARRARAHVRVSGAKEKGPNFFFTDRVSLTLNFLSLCEQVPPVSSWKVLHSNTLKSNVINNETKNFHKINRQTVNSDSVYYIKNNFIFI